MHGETKYLHVSVKYSRQLVADCYNNYTFLYSNSSWIQWVVRRNYKVYFVKTFRQFQRHCFRRFPRDAQLQRLREGPRHLLVINLMQAAIRRGGCDGGHSWVFKSNVQNDKASHPPTTQTSLAFHRDQLHVMHAAVCRWTARWNTSP